MVADVTDEAAWNKAVATVIKTFGRVDILIDNAAMRAEQHFLDMTFMQWREVIGIVQDIQFHTVGEAPALHVFVPWTQHTTGRPRLVVRSATGTGAAMAPTVRDVVQSVEPGTTIDQVADLDSLVSIATAQPRFTTRLVAAFGALALVLAAVGIYGTLAYVVGARTREFGIRIALGASRAGIVSAVVRRGLLPAIAGGVAGCAIAVVIARLFRALLFGIQPVDAQSCVAGVALLIAVAIVAAIGPARRAARIDPVLALRAD